MLFYRFILDTLVHLLPLAGAITTAHISGIMMPFMRAKYGWNEEKTA